MKFSRYPSLATAMLILAGCAQVASGIGLAGAPCVSPNSQDKANSQNKAGVDWNSARKINLRIRQDTFTPAYIGLIQGAPYRLVIENADDGAHVFRAKEFFNSVAVYGVRVVSGPGAGLDKGDACSGVVSIAPGGVTEVRFVSVRDGVYEFDENPPLMAFAMAGGAGGFIVVEPKRVIPESPVKHLKLQKRIPMAVAPVLAPTSGGGLFDGMPAAKQAPVVAVPDKKQKKPAITDKQLKKAPSADLFSN